ncbi:MAG: tetratricopeptide repeat protein [Nannocystaceae bacterium]
MDESASRRCFSEAELHALIAGELTDARREAVDAHVDACPRCFDLLAAAAIGAAAAATPSASGDPAASAGSSAPRVDGPALARGIVLGARFEVGELLGAGGMGVVYAARDRVLDREVALKVVRSERAGAGADARLLFEAKMLARLAHPNVVVVFDVIAGDEAIFLAMELVRGETLRAWVEGPPRRSPRAIVRAYVDAGRGLAAAHRQGIVHCDFKADNVLVGEDGRARVTDFGLARSPEDDAEREGPGLWLAGTPRYMAPEQLRGEPPSAQSDQFAFAVALYEGLARRDPFAAIRLPQRLAAIEAGPRALGRGLPRWLDGALRRALAADPAERFATMDALCDALERGLGRRARRRALGAGIAALGLSLAGLLAPADAGVCGDPARLLDGVWDADARRGLLAAAGADPASSRLVEVLDATAAAWVRTYAEVCRDDDGREEASTARVCLEQSLDVLRSVVSVAAHADPPTRAFLAEEPLEERLVDSCLNLEVTTMVEPLPAEPGKWRRALALRMRLGEAQRLLLAGRMGEAAALVRAGVAEAEALEYPPLLVEALLRRGQVEHRRGEVMAAQATLERALALAEEARYDVVLPLIWLELTVVDASLGLLSGARRGIDRAEGALARRHADPASRARVKSLRGHYLRSLGRHAEAIAADAEAEAIYATLRDPEVPVASALSAQALSLAALGRWEEAIAAQERALALRVRGLGPAHTRVAASLNNIGAAHLARGRLAEAEDHMRRALAIRAALGDDGELDRSYVLLNLGLLERARDQPEAALHHLREALRIRERLLEPDHLLRVEAALELGVLEVASGLDPEGGAARVTQAHARRLALLGAVHPLTALAAAELGIVELRTGSPARARETLERAAAALASAEVQPEQRARVAFALGQATLAGGGSPREARAQAERALATYRELGPGGAPEAAAIEAWLAENDV